jgi:hypothetical protein
VKNNNMQIIALIVLSISIMAISLHPEKSPPPTYQFESLDNTIFLPLVNRPYPPNSYHWFGIPSWGLLMVMIM